MTNVSDMTVGAFLDDLAAETSTPGGGAAAALAGSQAAALLSMVINFTTGRSKYADVEEEMQGYLTRSETLRRELLGLADRDAEAFDAVAACYSMPRSTDAEKAARTAAMQKALKGAAEVPYIVAEKCLTLLELAVPVGAQGNRNVVSDAATSAHLAYAALLSALANVNINLKYIRDESFVATWDAKAAQVAASAGTAYAKARSVCSETLGVPV